MQVNLSASGEGASLLSRSNLFVLAVFLGRFVALHPRYRRLFGAVSISDEFQSMTKQLLMAFLRVHSFDTERAALVQPRNPPKVQRFRDADERRLPHRPGNHFPDRKSALMCYKYSSSAWVCLFGLGSVGVRSELPAVPGDGPSAHEDQSRLTPAAMKRVAANFQRMIADAERRAGEPAADAACRARASRAVA